MNARPKEEVHRRGRRTAQRARGRGNLRGQGVIAEALEATVEHHVRVHVLERLEPGLGHVRRRVLSLDALDSLERIQVILVGDVITDDQVREVPAADQLDPEGVHLLEDRARRKHSASVGRGRPGLVLPESPHAAVDAANHAACGRRGDEQLQTADRVGNAAVAVDALGEAVHEGVFGIHDSALKEIDDRLFAHSVNYSGSLSGTSNTYYSCLFRLSLYELLCEPDQPLAPLTAWPFSQGLPKQLSG